MPRDWRRLAWKSAAALLFHGGVIDFRPRSGSGRRFILAYHRVIPNDSQDLLFVQPGMYVTAETFDMHLCYLLAHYEVVPLETLLTMEEGDACAITFDDGWRDNYDTALPILRQHSVPATVFLATSLVGSKRWPWPDRICFYVHRVSAGEFSAAFESAWQDEAREPLGASMASRDRFAAAEKVLRRLKRLDHGLLTRVVARIDDRFAGLDAALHEQRPWVTWEEALEMEEQGISFGSHTENHVILVNVPPAEARQEIVKSRNVLSARLGRPVTAFCYPNGSYNSSIVRMVAEAGYRCAVTTKSGLLDRSAGPLESNRIMIHDDISSSRALFACTLAGLSGFRQMWPVGRGRSG
jgi:peptidoglycan/xylan/chitin deacetylase (PgdA/CDA1 family)